MIRINSVNDPIPNEVHPHLSEIQNVSKITSIAETSHVMLLWLHANDAPILPHQYLFFLSDYYYYYQSSVYLGRAEWFLVSTEIARRLRSVRSR